MIDIHTHLLPCVDDGSQSVENSVEMAKELYEQGVKQIIITPHYRLHYRKTPQVLQTEFEQFKAKVQAQIPIDLYLGQEIYVEDNIKELCRLNKVLTMNGSKFLLCEFNYTHPCDISETVYELCSEGYVPIIAHVERYVYLTIDDIYEIKNEGGKMKKKSLPFFTSLLCGRIFVMKRRLMLFVNVV